MFRQPSKFEKQPNGGYATMLQRSQGADFFHMIEKISFAPALEGLRGFAVILVMMSHVLLHKEMLGTLGVGIFFVLSGFLITGVLIEKIKEVSSPQLLGDDCVRSRKLKRLAYLPAFYADRFVRLSPALLFMVATITWLCLRLGIARSMILPDALSSIFYLHNWFPKLETDSRMMKPGMFLNTWSLAVEEQFYCFWSIAILPIFSLRQNSRIFWLLGLTALSFTIRCYSGYAFLQPNMLGIDYRYAWSANVWKMFLGCTARLVPVPKCLSHPLYGLLGTMGLFLSVLFWGWVLPSHGFDFRTQGAFLEFFTSLLTLSTIIASLQGNRVLETKIFRFTGRISYSWYLWQFPLQAFAGWPINNWAPTGLAFMIATFSTFILEEPIRQTYRTMRLRTTSHVNIDSP